MEIDIFPNWARPGVGVKPRSDRQRPLLPQHARHCPVLEAGNSLGFLVYPALEEHEAFQIQFRGDGQYRFRYFMRNLLGKWETMFTVNIQLPVGSIGATMEEVEFGMPDLPVTKQGALKMIRAFLVSADLGTPTGAVTLRGAWNFKTPPGWDTVYTPVLNLIERPIAPGLVVRVETDWFPHDSEFRYVLQPGEGLPGARHLAIGQVLFVPREEHTLKEVGEEQLEALQNAKDDFLREKAKLRRTTRQGLEYSPHYARVSRSLREAEAAAVEENEEEE